MVGIKLELSGGRERGPGRADEKGSENTGSLLEMLLGVWHSQTGGQKGCHCLKTSEAFTSQKTEEMPF